MVEKERNVSQVEVETTVEITQTVNSFMSLGSYFGGRPQENKKMRKDEGENTFGAMK